jgi:hypothetical protein
MADLRRPILRRLALLLVWIENDLGERALDGLFIEKRSGAAKIESLLQCHAACLTNRRASRKLLLAQSPVLSANLRIDDLRRKL